MINMLGMDLLKSGEDYLERILMLEEHSGRNNVHSVELACSMGFSKPSISMAMKKLRENGYLSFGPKDELILSEKGREIAVSIYERHEIIAHTLIALGVSEDLAYEDACRIEHDLSPETFEIIKRHYLSKKSK